MGKIPTRPEKLYRYRSLSGDGILARELEALESGGLWFSNFHHLNDPAELSDADTETVPAGLGAYMEALVPGHGDAFEKVIKASLDYSAKGFLDKKTSGVCCLSEKSDHQAMWAYYADDFKGICIEYDTKILLSLQSFCMGNRVEKVIYRNERLILAQDAINMDIKSGLVPLTSKSTDWQHEKEWRLFLRNETGLRHHSMNAVSAIYLGAKFDTKSEEEITAIAEKLNAKIYKYEFDKYRMQPRLHFEPKVSLVSLNVPKSELFERTYDLIKQSAKIDMGTLDRAILSVSNYPHLISLGGINNMREKTLSIIISIRLGNGEEGIKILRFVLDGPYVGESFEYGRV